jgi:hypothetical protein
MVVQTLPCDEVGWRERRGEEERDERSRDGATTMAKLP